MKFFKHLFWSIAVLGIGFFASYFLWASSSLVYQNVSNKISTLCTSKNCVATVNNATGNSYSLKNKNKSLSISSEAYLIGDVDSGEIILSKDKDIRYPIASVTKLVTSLVAIEMFKDTQVLKDAAEKVQEIYGIKSKDTSNGNVQNTDFLYPLLLRSSNQTAEILANEVGWPNFIRQMNEKTSLLGMYSTLFDDPSGLSKKNISTAEDLFRLAKYLKNRRPEILELTKTDREETLGLVWTNNSRFLSNRGYLGGKTGFTNAAKQTLLAIFSVPLKDGSISENTEARRRNIAVIILQSPDRANDVQKILNYLRENVLYNKEELLIPEIQKEGEILNEDNMHDENSSYLVEETAPVIVTTLKKTDNLKIRDDRQEHFEINTSFEQPDWFPKNIIITIDDGPHIRSSSNQFLNILNKYSVKATFFMVGKFINKDYNNNPDELQEYLRKLLTYGHIIGYHSYKHRNFYFPGFPRLDQQSEDKIIDDISLFERTLNKALGNDYKLLYGRMPGGYGTFSEKVISAFKKMGLEKPKYWHTDKIPTDPAEIAKILNKKEQYIILLHDSKKGANDLEKFLKEVYRQIQINTDKKNNDNSLLQVTNDPQQSVSLAFVGDIMLDRGIKNSVTKNFGGDYNALFANLAELKDYNILFGNLEGPVSDKGNKVGSKYSFRMDPDVLPILKDAGFDIVSFANNHVGDFGLAGFKDTLSRLDSAGIAYIGAGLNKKDTEEPIIIEKNGIKIGFLGFSDTGPNWLTAKESTAGILLASDPNFEKIIQNAKTKSDILVVSFHFGEEYTKANTRQKTLAYKAIDNGADIIIGSHPHVIQETEKYNSPAGGPTGEGFIAYSLGNFIFDQYFSEETMQGLVLEINIDKEKNIEVNKKLIKLNREYQPEGLFSFNKDDFNYNNLKELSQNAKTNAELEKEKMIENICPVPKKTFPDLSLYNINLENSVGDYIPENLVPIKNQVNTRNKDICLTEQAFSNFKKMSEDAKKENANLTVTSGFRDTELQKYFYDQSIKKNSIPPEFLSVAPPSFSEHQLGTTVDLTSSSLNYASTSLLFDQTAEYNWLKDNAYKYGFVQSYPKEKESITDFVYEPWHWRFIGSEIAKNIKENDLTLSEYLNDYNASKDDANIGG